MKPILVEFCDGCGRVHDRGGSLGETDRWIDLCVYQEKYGFTWEELQLVHGACSECCKLFEIAHRRSSSQAEASP